MTAAGLLDKFRNNHGHVVVVVTEQSGRAGHGQHDHIGLLVHVIVRLQHHVVDKGKFVGRGQMFQAR